MLAGHFLDECHLHKRTSSPEIASNASGPTTSLVETGRKSYTARPVGWRMKRVAYILVIGLSIQWSGVRVACAPACAKAHDCCPPTHERPAHNPLPVPGCCRVCPASDPNLIAQPAATNELAGAALEDGGRVVLGLLLPPAATPVTRVARFQPISPPLSPLRQTCLLLI